MPIYEYGCGRCKKIFSFLVRNLSSHKPPCCPRCGKGGMKRRVSGFRIGRSNEARLEKLADPSLLAGVDEKDPRSLARWMKRMGSELGEDMPAGMGEMADRIEAGESPEDIEKDGGGDYARDSSGELYDA
ncbi:MAG: zinc ribbon domain-containing protein [Candidatus Aureabacteria bacterium]|nr:zinc ribbon domain-containing protein [Candidatus Auribacterota bacterium]